MTGPRSVRRKQQSSHQLQEPLQRNLYSSEPRLTETETPPQRRRGSTRRVQHGYGYPATQRKSAAFLDVPGAGGGGEEDEDNYRLRSFSITKGGVVNRGDSFRRRRSRSNSLVPPTLAAEAAVKGVPTPREYTSYSVAVLGAPGVGKTALINQFKTSECINAYDGQNEVGEDQTVSIMLNGEESELKFINITRPKEQITAQNSPDAFLVMYSVVDKSSFSRAEAELTRLMDLALLRTRPALLVGNKIDLARSRAVSAQDGRCLACTYRAKFVEVSVAINHNVDELLVGILNQIRLKLEHCALQGSREGSPAHWYKSRGVIRASMKARQVLTWILGKEDSKFKNCENLHEL
ncbi:GTP-binding protein Rit2 isoform X2 [Ctenocephalides felis]|nr:GTP-binding protein Rit2 isoform X2 [Ctenocephalides felis]